MQLEPSDKAAFEDILTRRIRLKSQQDQIKEDIKALAEKLDIRVSQVNKILGLVEKERSKGAILEEEKDNLETAQEVA